MGPYPTEEQAWTDETAPSTHLHVLQPVLLAYAPQHVLLAALLHLARQQQLVEDEVGLLEVEDDVELAHVAVVLVHLLHEPVDDLERDELVVGRVAPGDEEERRVSAVHDLRVCNRQRGAAPLRPPHLCIPKSCTFSSAERAPAVRHPLRSWPCLLATAS